MAEVATVPNTTVPGVSVTLVTTTGVIGGDGAQVTSIGSTLAANTVKTIIFALVTVGIVVANFFLESKLAVTEEKTATTDFTLSYTEDNIIADQAVVRFDGAAADMDASLGVGAGSSSAIDLATGYYLLTINQAHLWGNFLSTNAKVNLLAGNVVIIPNRAVFEMNFDDERLSLNTYNGDLYLGFLPKDFTLTGYLDPYNPIFINRLLVPRNSQVTVPLKKITEDLRPLLYSKLVKEFQYGAIPSSTKESEFVRTNIEKDERFSEALKQQFISDVIFKDITVKDSFLSDFVFWAEENLTLMPDKKREIIFAHLFAYLDDAIFYANAGDDEKMRASLDNFRDYGGQVVASEQYRAKLDGYIEALSIFGPADKEYKVLKFLLDRKFVEKNDVYDVVGQFWTVVYEGLDVNDLLAEESLNTYYEYLDQTLGQPLSVGMGQPIGVGQSVMYLTYQNQLFDNLLLHNSLFYKDGYFAIKNVLEQALLDLYADGQLKDELKQAFVSHKIDFLKRLRKFFFDGEVEVLTAKEVFSRLFEEIDKLMPADRSGVAVIELFESQLNDIDDFWGYLNSPEYHGNVYGSTNEERYQNYLVERNKIWSFINIREDVLGDAADEEQDVLAVISEIEAGFYQTEDLSNLEIAPIDSVDQRYVEVRATIGGYPFKANYDRDTQSLKDIYVYDELVSDRAVKLGSLLTLLQEKFADLADEIQPEDGEDVTLETTAQRYARIFIANKVKEFGFLAEMENVSVVDEVSAIYRVEDGGFEGYEDLEITFDIIMTGEIVTNVFMKVNGKPTVLNEEYTLEQLAGLVKAEQEGGILEVDEGAVEASAEIEEGNVFAPVLR